MRILNNQQINGLLRHNEIISSVEAAMITHEDQSSAVPQRMKIAYGDNTLLCMPAFSPDFFATKLVSVVPGNTALQLPVTNGILILNDAHTGLPLAVMNAAKLTALRTGAVGSLGIKYLTPENSDSIGLVGSGIQGVHQAIFACGVRPIKTVYCLYRNDAAFINLAAFINQYFPDVKTKACQTAEELLQRTQIIIAATTSTTPVLPEADSILENKHYFSIGSFKPTMQELPDSVFRLAGQLVLDSEFAREEAGDAINPVQQGILRNDELFTLGKVILGLRKIDINKTTAFKSTGMALFDLFVAEAMYHAAVNNDIGYEVEI